MLRSLWVKHQVDSSSHPGWLCQHVWEVTGCMLVEPIHCWATGLYSVWSLIFQQAGSGAFLLQKPGKERERRKERERGKKLLEIWAQNWCNITSAIFYWPKQVTRLGEIQGWKSCKVTHCLGQEFRGAINWGISAVSLPHQDSDDFCLILKRYSCLRRILTMNTHTERWSLSHPSPMSMCCCSPTLH